MGIIKITAELFFFHLNIIKKKNDKKYLKNLRNNLNTPYIFKMIKRIEASKNKKNISKYQ